MTASAARPAPEMPERDGRRRALVLLALALVLSMTTWFSATAVIPQLREEWHLSTTTTSWLTISVQLGFVLGAVISSVLNLADLVPAQRLMSLGAVGAATANVLLVVAHGPELAIPLRAATGLMLAGTYPPALKLMATWFPHRRGAALGVLVGALTLGSAAPHLVNALGGADWHLVVYATSAMTVLGGLVALRVGLGPAPFPAAVFDPRQARIALKNRGVRMASIGYFGHMWELYAMWGWFAIFFREYLERNGTPSPTQASAAAFAAIGIGALGCWIGGVLGDGWGRTRTTAAMMVVSGACALSIGFFIDGPAWVVLAIGLIWGFSVVADSAQFSTIVTELADQAYVGTALTLQLALGFTLTTATLWLVPEVAAAHGWEWAFVILVPGPAVGAFAMLRLLRMPEARLIAAGRG
jgi:MFS family permease